MHLKHYVVLWEVLLNRTKKKDSFEPVLATGVCFLTVKTCFDSKNNLFIKQYKEIFISCLSDPVEKRQV